MSNHPIVQQKSKVPPTLLASSTGRVAPAILLWLLGVPGGIVLLLWFFFWRGN